MDNKSVLLTPVLAFNSQLTQKFSDKLLINQPDSACSWVDTPTPAAAESPAISNAKGAFICWQLTGTPLCASPLRCTLLGTLLAHWQQPTLLPVGSGNLSVFFLTSRPCTSKIGKVTIMSMFKSKTLNEINKHLTSLHYYQWWNGFTTKERPSV